MSGLRPSRGVIKGRSDASLWGIAPCAPRVQLGPDLGAGTWRRQWGGAVGGVCAVGGAYANPRSRWALGHQCKGCRSAEAEQVSWRASWAWGALPGPSHLQRGGRRVEPRPAGRALPSSRSSPRPLTVPSPVPGCSPCARGCPGLCGRRGGGRGESAERQDVSGSGPELGLWKERGSGPRASGLQPGRVLLAA